MDTKVNYHYSYFIYSYFLKDVEYREYVLNLLNNKKYNLKIFEKEKDLEIYEFFKSNIKEEYFKSFNINKNNYDKEKILENKCVIFEYLFDNKKDNIEIKNELFFEVSKIELICFNTGVCFLVFKTQLLNEKIGLKDILNFNYKMKDTNSEFSKLKSYDNIHINSNFFDDINNVNKKIEEIILCKTENKRFFTYSYACVDSENWNNEVDKLENDFFKYVNVYPSNYDMTFEEENIILRINNWKYIKIGFTNESMNLLTNNMETSNFTKLQHDYENKYLYNLILNLYKKELLENIENNNIKFKSLENYKIIYKEIINNDFTEDNIGIEINKKLNKIFDLNKKIEKIEKLCKKNFEFKVMKKYKNLGRIILIILLFSLLFNLFLLN